MTEAALPELDEFQRAAWEDIKAGRNVLVTGSAGVGKSALVDYLQVELEKMGKRLALTAMTGTAAEIIGGTTLHSTLGYQRPQVVGDFEIPGKRRGFIAALHVLVIDEASMLSAEFFTHMVDAITAVRQQAPAAAAATEGDAEDCDGSGEGAAGREGGAGRRAAAAARPLGGLQLVLVGDFLQLAPVCKPNEYRRAQAAAREALARHLAESDGLSLPPGFVLRKAPFLNRGLAFQSPRWKDCSIVVHELKHIHRQSNAAFIRTLQALRVGRPSDQQLAELCACGRPLRVRDGILPTELHSLNQRADSRNQQELSKLQTPLHCFPAHDFVEAKSYRSDRPGDFERRATRLEAMRDAVLDREGSRIGRQLNLKIGAQVMLCVNISTRQPLYLVNGSRGVVVGWVGAEAEQARVHAEMQRVTSLLRAGGGAGGGAVRAPPKRRRLFWDGGGGGGSVAPPAPGVQAGRADGAASPPPAMPGAAEAEHQQRRRQGGGRPGEAHAGMDAALSQGASTQPLPSASSGETGRGAHLHDDACSGGSGCAAPAGGQQAPPGAAPRPGAAPPPGGPPLPQQQRAAQRRQGQQQREAQQEQGQLAPTLRGFAIAIPSAREVHQAERPTAAPIFIDPSTGEVAFVSGRAKGGSPAGAASPAAAARAPGGAAAMPPPPAPGAAASQPPPRAPAPAAAAAASPPPAPASATPGAKRRRAGGGASGGAGRRGVADSGPERLPGGGWGADVISSSDGEADVEEKEEEEEEGGGGSAAYVSSPHRREAPARQLALLQAKAATLGKVVEQFGSCCILPLVQFASCAKPVCVHPHLFTHKVRNMGNVCRIQIPLALAWAMTIHKSQGATLDRVKADLSGCFATGQVYVALSRARDLESMQVVSLEKARVTVDEAAVRFYQRRGAVRAADLREYPTEADLGPEFYRAWREGRPVRAREVLHLMPPPLRASVEARLAEGAEGAWEDGGSEEEAWEAATQAHQSQRGGGALAGSQLGTVVGSSGGAGPFGRP